MKISCFFVKTYKPALLYVSRSIASLHYFISLLFERQPFSGLFDSPGVATQSFADSNFHDHCPAVQINQHLLRGLMSIDLGALTQWSVHSTSPVLLSKNGPLRTLIMCPISVEQVGFLTNLKFENTLSGKKRQGRFSSGKNLVTSEKLVPFPQLIFQICHFSPTNF